MLSVVGYLQALRDLVNHSVLIYDEIKQEKECEKEKDNEEYFNGDDE